MRSIDKLVFAAYLVGIVALGVYFSRKQKSNKEFFLAGRKMHWFPIGLSIMATLFSAISYTAFPGEIFANGLYAVMAMPVFVIVAIPIMRIVMPFYHEMKLCTAYEYMEMRFNVQVRCLSSALFIIWRTFWMATALYAPCKVLSTITGYPIWLLILIAGVGATGYTVLGGMRAVMWTDVAQFFVLFGGMAVGGLIIASRLDGGVAGLLGMSVEGGLTKPFYPIDWGMFSPDPRIRITLWSCWIGTFVTLLASYSVDQVVVQRYFTAETLKEAKRGFRLNYISVLVSYVCLAFMGFSIFAFAKTEGLLGQDMKPIEYLAKFVQSCPFGTAGLLVAGLFAATMSSVDSGINSCTAAFMTDFYNRFTRGIKRSAEAEAAEQSEQESDEAARHSLMLSRVLTLGLGALATFMAFYVGELGTIFEIASKIINGFGSPLLAILLLGMFSKRANSEGMLIGGILGTCLSAYVSFCVEGIAIHYYSVVNLIGTLVLCYGMSLVMSLFFGKSTEEQLKWTWWARRRLKNEEEA